MYTGFREQEEIAYTITTMSSPDLSDPFYSAHALRLCFSYRHWTGLDLLPENPDGFHASALFEADFVLVSHGVEPVPVFNFGNRAALNLFESSWEQFIKMPSKTSADQDNQTDRAELMARVRNEGYATGCRGVRVSVSGKRFLIEDATVWNVIDEQGQYHGQAAMFERWYYL